MDDLPKGANRRQKITSQRTQFLPIVWLSEKSFLESPS